MLKKRGGMLPSSIISFSFVVFDFSFAAAYLASILQLLLVDTAEFAALNIDFVSFLFAAAFGFCFSLLNPSFHFYNFQFFDLYPEIFVYDKINSMLILGCE